MSYMFDAAWQAERERLAGIESMWDPTTINHLTAVGVRNGWSCLEVGAGGGSVAQWLSSQVGSTGEVIATDRDITFLAGLAHIQVLTHDILCDSLPHKHFDLIHARLVLSHLPERDQVLAKLANACKPGGWVVLEEFNESDVRGSAMHRPRANPIEAAEVLWQAWPLMGDFVRSSGYDPDYGGRLTSDMHRCGLQDVGSADSVQTLQGGTKESNAYRNSMIYIGEAMIAKGLLREEQLGPVVDLFNDPGFRMMTPAFVTAWGRRPTTDE